MTVWDSLRFGAMPGQQRVFFLLGIIDLGSRKDGLIWLASTFLFQDLDGSPWLVPGKICSNGYDDV
jgi:hypothetical protein